MYVFDKRLIFYGKVARNVIKKKLPKISYSYRWKSSLKSKLWANVNIRFSCDILCILNMYVIMVTSEHSQALLFLFSVAGITTATKQFNKPNQYERLEFICPSAYLSRSLSFSFTIHKFVSSHSFPTCCNAVSL